jgi:hypothetical protein
MVSGDSGELALVARPNTNPYVKNIQQVKGTGSKHSLMSGTNTHHQQLLKLFRGHNEVVQQKQRNGGKLPVKKSKAQ